MSAAVAYFRAHIAMKTRWRGLLAASLLWPHFYVHAASVDTICPDAKVKECHVVLSGQVAVGDAEKLRRQLRTPPKPEQVYRGLLLDSPGGDLIEAVAIARVVREALLETSNFLIWIDPTTQEVRSRVGTCASACVLIWAAGTERTHSTKEGQGIGLHRPYFERAAYEKSPAAVADAHRAADEMVSTFLRRERVPDRLIDEMLARSSRDIYWLSSNEDTLPLWGKASWFEEMLIARCNFNPVKNLQLNAEFMREIEQLKHRTGSPRRPKLEALQKWQLEQGQCEQELRRKAQAALRQ